MEHSEIAKYIDGLEEALYEWDNSPAHWHCELEKIHTVIKRLMDDTFNEPVKKKRTSLAVLEYKARKVRDCIMRRNGMKN